MEVEALLKAKLNFQIVLKIQKHKVLNWTDFVPLGLIQGKPISALPLETLILVLLLSRPWLFWNK